MDQRYTMLGAVAAIVGGLAILAGGVFELMDLGAEEVALSVEAQDASFGLMVAPFVVGAIALSIALPALHLHQASRTGSLGVGAFVLAAVGLAFMIGFSFIFAFVVPTLATSAPEFLDADDPGPPLAYLFMIGFPLFMLGLLAFAATVVWAGVFPRWTGWLLVGGMLLDFVGELAESPVSGAFLSGLAFIGMGWRLWQGATSGASTMAARSTA